MSDEQLNALMVEQNVHMGDHAETITKAVAIDPDETVQALVDRTLYKRDGYNTNGYLVIRVTQRFF